MLTHVTHEVSELHREITSVEQATDKHKFHVFLYVPVIVPFRDSAQPILHVILAIDVRLGIL